MMMRLYSGAVGGALAVAMLAACAVEAAPSTSASALPARAIVAQAPPPTAQPITHDAGVWCDIRITRTRDGLRFAPVAGASAYQDVSYRFTLTRIDANGSSDIEQGGDISLVPQQRVTLSSSEISVDPGGSFRARLVVEDAYGVLCREEARS
jgi:hypothetical protein